MSRHTPRDRAYWALREQVRKEEPDCWLCGEPIPPNLRWPHPASFSTDHIRAASLDPSARWDRENLRAAHLQCNRSRGNGRPQPTQRRADPGPSRRW